MFPSDALQITPNVQLLSCGVRNFLPRLVALPHRRWYRSWLLKMFTDLYLRIGGVCIAQKSIAVSWFYS